MTISFVYGLIVITLRLKPVLLSIHGWLGLSIMIISIFQVLPCYIFKTRKRPKHSHMLLGYSLGILVTVQATIGLFQGVVDAVKPFVVLHSVFGAIAAFSLTWIIIETYNLTENGILRIKIAGWVAAIFNIIGCWILGGYYYLTFYATDAKLKILESNQPWAHQILMETKEHIFLFLPIITLSIALILLFQGKDNTLLTDKKAQRSIILLSFLALSMIILLFIFGSLISYTANVGFGGA